MRPTPITDLTAQVIDGQLIYVDSPGRSLSLGVVPPTITTPPPAPSPVISPALASNIASATNVLNAASSAIPQQNIVIQTDFSKVMNTVASLAATTAAVTACFFPAGTVVAIVAGVVAAAAALLGKIFARAKSKELDAQRAQWDALNAQLKTENADLDLKYENLKANMATFRKEVSNLTGIDFTFGKDNSVQGLGFCIFNCKKKAAEQNLNTSKQQNESLKKAQTEKIALIQELLKEWDILTAAAINFKNKGKQNAMLITGFALAAGIGVYLVAKRN